MTTCPVRRVCLPMGKLQNGKVVYPPTSCTTPLCHEHPFRAWYGRSFARAILCFPLSLSVQGRGRRGGGGAGRRHGVLRDAAPRLRPGTAHFAVRLRAALLADAALPLLLGCSFAHLLTPNFSTNDCSQHKQAQQQN